ncbi:unnamed protein product, partial [Closterium sp. Naga37s-1]
CCHVNMIRLIFVGAAIFLVSWLVTWLYPLVAYWRRGNKFPGPKCQSFWGNLKEIQDAGGMSGMKNVLAAMHAKYGPVVRLWLNPVRLLISVEDPQQVRNVLMHARERSPLYCRVIEACLGKNSACFSTFIQPRARRSFLDYHCRTTLKFQVHEVACRVADVTAREWGALSASGGELDVTQACKDMVVGVLGGSLFGPAFPDSDLKDRVAGDLEFFAHSVQDFASFSYLPVWLPAYKKLMGVAEDYRGAIHQLVSGTFAKDVKQQRKGHALWGGDAADFNPDRFIHFRWHGAQQQQQQHQQQHHPHQQHHQHEPRSHSFAKRDTRVGVGLGPVSHREAPQGFPGVGIGGGGEEGGRKPGEAAGARGASPWREGRMVPGHDYEFVAPEPGPQFLMFGAGARSCVGQRLSLKIIRAAVAILLHRFEFSMSPDMPKEFDTRLEFMVLHLHPTPRLKLALPSSNMSCCYPSTFPPPALLRLSSPFAPFSTFPPLFIPFSSSFPLPFVYLSFRLPPPFLPFSVRLASLFPPRFLLLSSPFPPPFLPLSSPFPLPLLGSGQHFFPRIMYPLALSQQHYYPP